MNIYLTHTSAQKDLFVGTRCSLDTNDGGVIVSGRGEGGGLIIPTEKTGSTRTTDFFYRLALAQLP